ncbi:UPF0481 protein At3g47200-like [Eucalyptus grandis]|uniref:UPF0481 protein At3g47200-like n=1 Tax=Eucalyptus grandis TaxID=71139 RepID=UPI00192EB5EF|nr:UPF0481 protein At3g47200-like [Eucalyptus grandis]
MSNHQLNQYARNNGRSGIQDHALIYIEDMLCGVPPTLPEHSIFRVRPQLRRVNNKAYEPEILVVGPHHYGNDKFKSMEEQKMRYVQQLLQRRKEESIDRYMPTLRELEQLVRNCYAETINLSQEKFLAMMFIDGCFIVELFRKYNMEKLRNKDGPLMEADWIRYCLQRDLLLLENQLPLFFLNKLYDLTKRSDEPRELIDIATTYFDFKLGDSGQCPTLRESKHLLHLMHTCWTSGLPNVPRLSGRAPPTKEKLMFMSSATELRESGVKLRAVRGRHMKDIRFENGKLEIPVLIVQDHTESQFRNLIAYEQHRQGGGISYFTDYVTLMDCLINSSKDVEVLRRAGIIKNYLGDDEVIAQMFNRMGDYVTLPNFYYSEIFKTVNAYCNKRRNVWMAKLRREYFHSPWAFLSVLAAIVLLLLAAAQTVFTILSYTK